MRRIFSLIAILTVARVGDQIPANNPLIDAAHAIGSHGLGAEKVDKAAGWPFKPTGGRILVKGYAASLGSTVEERDALESGILAVIDRYEAVAKGVGQPNDPATALAFAVAVLTSATKGTELDDQAFLALAPRLRATLLKAPATDRQKQELYEYALSASGMVVALSAATKDPSANDRLRTLADVQLLALIGVKADSITLKGALVSIKAPTEEASVGGTAPGLKARFPQGWREGGGWHVADKREGHVASSALVRLVPAVPAKGSFSEALRAAWNQHVPEELRGKASGMVFRRYVGDGLVSQFICGAGPEKGRKWDSMFTVYLVDCGATWQPIVVAQVRNDSSSPNPIFSPWTISGSYRKSAPFVEDFLKGLSCPAAKGRTLVDKASLAGSYRYGNTSTLQYENVYTGATAMTAFSYGGELDLLPTGKFTENYSSAGGMVGNLKFRGYKARGVWTIQGDLLTLTDTFYDQGDGYRRKPKRFRVAGIVVFADGQKVVVLKDNLDEAITPLTVGDRSEYYSTAKKP